MSLTLYSIYKISLVYFFTNYQMKANTNSLTYISENFNIGDYEFDEEYSYDNYKFRDSGSIKPTWKEK